ncbi:MAG: glycosyltransferase [Halobacteriota archaeon]
MTKIKSNPAVSAIIPTYNRAHLIGRAVQSVLNQTYQDFEILIIDDGSTDNTEEIIKSFRDERIRHIRHERNKGAAAARNTGIKAARGEYIAFQDSDDEWYSNKLEEISKIIEERKDVDFITSYGKIIKNGKIIGDIGRAPWVNVLSKTELIIRLFISNFIPTQGVVVKKEKIVEVGGFDESLPSASDYELWLRLAPICTLYFVNKPLFNLYFSQKSLTSDIGKRIKSQVHLFNKNQKILKKFVNSKILYYIIRQRCLSNIFNTAARDIERRQNNKKLALLLYLLSFIFFPNFGILCFTKRLVREA